MTGGEAVYAVQFLRDFTVCIDTFGSEYDTVLYVRTTCEVETDVVCDDDTDGLQSEVQFDAVAGQVYFVVVDAFGAGEGEYTFDLRLGPCGVAPSAEVCDDGLDNDQDGSADCDDAECADQGFCVDALYTCANAPFVDEGANVGTTAGLENIHEGSCQTLDGPEAVHRIAVTADTTVCLDTAGSSFDTVLYVREAACGDGDELGCHDDVLAPDLTSQLEVELVAGEVYFVFVDGFNGQSGDYTLNVNVGPCGPEVQEVCDDGVDNDDDGLADCDDDECADTQLCLDAQYTCQNAPFIVADVTVGNTALLDDLHDGSCQFFGSSEAVHRLAVTEDTTVCIDTVGSTYDTVLYAREGQCDAPGAELTCNDDNPIPDDVTSQIQLDLVADTLYFIFVDGFFGGAGDYTLNIAAGPCP